MTAKVFGQTCSDDGTCVIYEEDLTSQGPGDDGLFADFPADLLPGAGGSGEASASQDAAPGVIALA